MEKVSKETMKMAFIGDHKNRRTYDPETNAELLYKSRERDGLTTLELYVGGQNVRIRATSDSISNESQGLQIKWNVLAVRIPPDLESKKPEILKMVKDALTAFGINHGSNKNNIVTVEFSPTI